jgi:REP element-mobilizing transposase RayT
VLAQEVLGEVLSFWGGTHMGRPVRHLEPESCYFVTARCTQARLLLRPSSETNALLGGALARAVALYGVELFGYVVASNHLHLLVRAPKGNLPKFMQYLLANAAKKIGRLVSWRGCFWERRYSAEPVLDDEAMVGRLRYILSHGVKEKLVRRCSHWPGLSCLSQLLGNRVRRFQWYDWTKRWKWTADELKGRELLDQRWAREVELEVKPLPSWAHLPEEVQRERVCELVASIESDGTLSGGGVLGGKAVLSQQPHRRPVHIKRTPRPLCHASTREGWEYYRELYAGFIAAFREASKRWRSGKLGTLFPELAVRPFLWPGTISASAA